eukprot:EG_transcript_7924
MVFPEASNGEDDPSDVYPSGAPCPQVQLTAETHAAALGPSAMVAVTPPLRQFLEFAAQCVPPDEPKLARWFAGCAGDVAVAAGVLQRAQAGLAAGGRPHNFAAMVERAPPYRANPVPVAAAYAHFLGRWLGFPGALGVVFLQRLHRLRPPRRPPSPESPTTPESGPQGRPFGREADSPSPASECPSSSFGQSYTHVTFQDILSSCRMPVDDDDDDDEADLSQGLPRYRSAALVPSILKRPLWVEDAQAPQCFACQARFHLLLRRHHCRMCGLVYCWRCSRHRIRLPEMNYDMEVRVCSHCHDLRMKKKTSKWQRILEEFDILNMVGAGGIGKVYKVVQKATGRVFAMKVIEKRSIRSEHCALGVGAEKFVLSKIDHPFIIKLHHTFQTHDKLFFVVDFMSRGDLFHLMTTVRIPERAVRVILAEIAMALNYLHEHRWIYRDLKPENCLLTDEGHVVLTDLGMALSADEESLRKYTAPVGTPEYWSPELIRGLGYTVALDYWQLGVLMCELLTGVHPFMDKDGQVYVDAIEKRPPKLVVGAREISANCQNLVGMLLRKNHLKRLQDWASFTGHKWFAG